MKNTIVNILIIVLMFNVIMLVFPEGKTQKFCKLTIKLFLMIYIINSIFFKGSIAFEDLIDDIPTANNSYEREISIKNIDKEFIDNINKDNYQGEEVIKEVILLFNKNMEITAKVSLNKLLNVDDTEKLKKNISEIFKISAENIEIDL